MGKADKCWAQASGWHLRSAQTGPCPLSQAVPGALSDTAAGHNAAVHSVLHKDRTYCNLGPNTAIAIGSMVLCSESIKHTNQARVSKCHTVASK
jgi:hypothetical protein